MSNNLRNPPPKKKLKFSNKAYAGNYIVSKNNYTEVGEKIIFYALDYFWEPLWL